MEKSNEVKSLKPLMDLSVLMQAIGIIGRATIKTEAQIQYVAVQCIAQSIVHRNATPAKELYDNLPKGFRHDSLAAYFEKFGNLAFKDKSIVFFDCEKLTGKKLEWTPVYEISVEAMHWTNGTKKPVPKSVYDADEEIGKVLERLVKLASDSTKTMKNKELLDRVVATYNAYSLDAHGAGGQTAEEIAGEVVHATSFNNSMAAIRELTDDAETAALTLASKEQLEALVTAKAA